jgi:pyrroloquinoline quinone (PQQ) biosynthesis protein C
MSIAEQLKAEVEKFSEELQRSHPLMRQALQGQVEAPTVLNYLAGVRYLLQHSCPHLDAARRTAESRGDAALAAFFRLKRRQEQGHERWADSDVGEMVSRFGLTVPEPGPAMKELVQYIESLTRTNPAHYLGYVFFAELVTVLAGPPWVAALEQHCRIPTSALSSVVNHIELDKSHVAEGMREMDQLLHDMSDPRPLLKALQGAMRRFELFLDELYELQLERSGASADGARCGVGAGVTAR